MPLYDFHCLKCGCIREQWVKVDHVMDMCDCGNEMRRLISSNYSIHADYASSDFVTDDITGNPVRVTSRRQLRKLMRDNGVTEKEAPSRSEINYRNEKRAHLRDLQLREQQANRR